MRDHNADEEWPFFKRLQSVFYGDGVDVTDPAEYRTIVAAYDVEIDSFLEDLVNEKSRLAAWEDFERAQVLQAQGFPTLLLRTGSDMATVTRGYRSFEEIELHLTAYLADRYDASDFLAEPA